MKTEFSKDYMEVNRGCYSIEGLYDCSFMKNESISLDDILGSEIPLKHKFWFVFKKCDLTKKQIQYLCIELATITLPICESRYYNDAPREVLLAAKEYLNGNINRDQLFSKRDAAFAAAAAAFADAAAAFAADADAFAFAADAADAYKSLLLDKLREFINKEKEA